MDTTTTKNETDKAHADAASQGKREPTTAVEAKLRHAAREATQAAEAAAAAGEKMVRDTVEVISERARSAAASAGATSEASMRTVDFGREQALKLAEGTSQRAAEETSDAMKRSREYFEKSGETARSLFDIWANGAETSLRAALEMQTATLTAGISMLDAATDANKEAFRQWSALAQKAQDAALEAWRSSVKPRGPEGKRGAH